MRAADFCLLRPTVYPLGVGQRWHTVQKERIEITAIERDDITFTVDNPVIVDNSNYDGEELVTTYAQLVDYLAQYGGSLEV